MQKKRTAAKIAESHRLTSLDRGQDQVGEDFAYSNGQTCRLGSSQPGPSLRQSGIRHFGSCRTYRSQTSPRAGASWLILTSNAFSISLIRGRAKVMLFTAT